MFRAEQQLADDLMVDSKIELSIEIMRNSSRDVVGYRLAIV